MDAYHESKKRELLESGDCVVRADLGLCARQVMAEAASEFLSVTVVAPLVLHREWELSLGPDMLRRTALVSPHRATKEAAVLHGNLLIVEVRSVSSTAFRDALCKLCTQHETRWLRIPDYSSYAEEFRRGCRSVILSADEYLSGVYPS